MTEPTKDIVLEFEGLLQETIKGLPEKVQVKVWEALKITEDIDTEVDRAAAWYGYYAVLSEKANLRLLRMEIAFDLWREENAQHRRNEFASLGKKPPTPSQMSSYLKNLAKYRGYEVQLAEYQYERDVLKVIAKAFEMKKDLVQTKAANRRKESRP